MIRKLLRKLYHQSKIEESKKRYSFIQKFDSTKTIRQELAKKDFYSIAFLLPGIPAYSGGITVIFRLGTYLTKFGHAVSFIDCSNAPVEDSKKNASISFSGYQGNIVTLDSLQGAFDIGICTLWDTAFVMHQYEKMFDYKMYFIQDFEPSFYPLGDLHFMCRKTYMFGFHMVSLGPWNAQKVRENFPGVTVDAIEFPVEYKIYELTKRTVSIDKTLDIAIFVKHEPKRAPDLIPQCLLLLNEQMLKRGISLNCWIFGTDIPFGIPFAKSLGMLSHDNLVKLYNKCQFGLVASLTNISNVTFEMMASGLPVIDFKEGSAASFFDNDQMILIDSTPSDLCSKINYYIDHQEELNRVISRAQKSITSRTWEHSAEKFNSIIKSI